MNEILDAVFSSVLLASRDASILALAVGIILFSLGRKIPPVWRHVLWLVVVVRLLLPAVPDGKLSWQRLLPEPRAAAVEIAPTNPPPDSPELSETLMEPPVAVPTAPPFRDESIDSVPDKTLFHPASNTVRVDWRRLLILAWGTGTLAYLILVFALDLRLRRRLQIYTERNGVRSGRAGNLLNQVSNELHLRCPTLLITSAVPVPAVTGLLRPAILLPPATLERLDETELRLVLLHELAHLHRRDLWLNWLLALLQAVHWFNPVIWWAFHRVRVEAEGAADAWVLHRCGTETPSQYGEALLRLLEVENPRRRIAVPGVVGVVESPRDLRSRIQMIARFSRKRNRIAAFGTVGLIVGLAAVGLTQAPVENEAPAPKNERFALPESIDSPVTRTTAVEVEIVDETGNPVDGAEVFVTAGNDHLAQALTPILLRGRTDESGKLVGRTAPVREDSEFGLLYVVAFFDGLAGFGWLSPKPDPIHGKVDFENETVRTRLVLIPVETIQAKVVLPDGSPAVGLRVWVDAIGLPAMPGDTFPMFCNPPKLPEDFWQAVTDADGVLELGGIPRGARIHLGHREAEWAAFPGYHNYFKDGLAAADKNRALTLAPAASVSGKVRAPSGKGVPNVVVEILEHTPYVNAYHGYAVSDENGAFRLDSIPDGHYRLSSRGRAGHHQNFWVLDGGKDLELTAGETVVDHDFEFKQGGRLVMRLVDGATGELITEGEWGVGLAGPARNVYHSGLTPAGYHENRQMHEGQFRAGEITYLDIPLTKKKPEDRIAGTVVDAAGIPVAGAKVKCPTSLAAFHERMMIETDDAGRFAFDLPAGTKEAWLIAWKDNRMSDPAARYQPGAEVKVTLSDGQPGTVVGRVVDGNGKPLPGAEFYSTGEELPGLTSPSVETDGEGRFRIAVVPEDLVTFWISKSGYTKVARQGKIESGTETDLGDIALEVADAFVAGQVIDTKGRPVPRAQVGVDGENQPSIDNVVTDGEGRFRIQGVAKGWLFVSAYNHLDDGGLSGKSRVRSGSEDVQVTLKHSSEWKPEEIVDFIGKTAPPLKIDHWYNAPSPNPDHKGKIRMIRFVGKDRPLIYLSGTVTLMQKLQDEFAGQDVEFLLVHGPWPKEEVDEILAAEHPDLTVPLAIESEKEPMSDAFGVQTWLTVVIDREGKVVFQDHSGKGSKAAVQKLLDAESKPR